MSVSGIAWIPGRSTSLDQSSRYLQNPESPRQNFHFHCLVHTGTKRLTTTSFPQEPKDVIYLPEQMPILYVIFENCRSEKTATILPSCSMSYVFLQMQADLLKQQWKYLLVQLWIFASHPIFSMEVHCPTRNSSKTRHIKGLSFF